ncbi:MAG: hypothetical protein KAS86_04615 [Candidatus Omnitrophica bacterium]|nr:hypothetical protein [Candidatus Omnitrophota bacterium]
MKKKYIQACEVGGSIYGKKHTTEKRNTAGHGKASKKDIVKVYNRFYRDQVAALYRAIHHDG